jgi:hypothetical protein
LGHGQHWFHNLACLVDDRSAGGGQGRTGRQVVVTAQQQISRIRPSDAWRDENPDDRSGWAAAAAIGKTGRTGPASLVIGDPVCRLGPAAREPHHDFTSI